jgi:hypothetical protein
LASPRSSSFSGSTGSGSDSGTTRPIGAQSPARGSTGWAGGPIYLLLGGALIATSFGWNPFGGFFSGDTDAPAKDQAPTSGGVPIDKLPSKPDTTKK